MKIEIYRFNLFEENTYVVYDNTGECVIVDPGCYSQEEQDFLLARIKKLTLKPKYIVNTHCHSDHILGVDFVKKTYNIPFVANRADEYLLKDAQKFASAWGWNVKTGLEIDIDAKEGHQILFGNSKLEILHTPGHTPGQIAIYSNDDKFMFVGDTIFKGTVGRTDLPGGNYNQMMLSIREKILKMPSDFVIFPGHGPETSIGVEIQTNPMLFDD